MEYDKLNLRFPWRFFQGKNIITADSILYGTRNLERKYCKGLEQRKSSLTKRQRKDFEPMSLWIKWKKKFSISKNQACQHKHFIARRKELIFKKPWPGRGLEKKNKNKKKTITIASLLALIIDTRPLTNLTKITSILPHGQRNTHPAALIMRTCLGVTKNPTPSQSTINHPFKIILGKGMLKVTTL